MKKSVVILLHICYWMMYLLMLYLFFLASNSQHPKNIFPGWEMFNVLVSSAIIPALLGFYASYAFLFPRFLKKKKILGLLLSGLLVYFACALIQDIYLSIVPGPGIFAAQWDSAIGITIMLTFIALIAGVMGLILKGFINWYGDIKLKADLNKKNYEMELALVKSQINPHFLFNTINNIDALIAKDASSASAYLNKLSDIMRFMLYETKTEKIPLIKELTYIEKFIELQKIRTTNPHYVNYTVAGDASNLMIPPMLLIPFIENAFKHTENKKEENAINIHLDIDKNKLIFKCENNYNPHSQLIQDGHGLGSELIKKRLSLLYPDTHTLIITNNFELYKVELTLAV